MSSTSRRVDDPSSFTLERPHFFKIILDDTIRKGKLGIPSSFVKNHGSSLPNVVFLRVPNGPDWRVELSRHNGDVCLHNGWREFAEHYSLDFGHLLVFEHKGHSQFYVIIFDKSATEINYPYYGTVGGEERDLGKKPETEKTMRDDAVEISDGLTTNKRARASFESLQPHKKIKNGSASQTKHSLKTIRLSRKNDAQCNGSKPETSPCFPKEFVAKEIGAGRTSSGWRMSKDGVVDRTLSLTSEEKAEALERASAFQSEYPYFVMVMQPAYVSCTRQRLAIPIPFSRKHLEAKLGDITLCVSDGRTWSAKYQVYGSQCSETKFITNGWKGFVHDNSLKVGDVCAFELIRTSDIKFKVSIFRAVEDPNLLHSLGQENRPNSIEPRRSLETNIVPDCSCKNESGVCGLCAGDKALKGLHVRTVKEEEKFTSE